MREAAAAAQFNIYLLFNKFSDFIIIIRGRGHITTPPGTIVYSRYSIEYVDGKFIVYADETVVVYSTTIIIVVDEWCDDPPIIFRLVY